MVMAWQRQRQRTTTWLCFLGSSSEFGLACVKSVCIVSVSQLSSVREGCLVVSEVAVYISPEQAKFPPTHTYMSHQDNKCIKQRNQD